MAYDFKKKDVRKFISANLQSKDNMIQKSSASF